ncbi:hypothetical protein PV08_04905 [Exophiala spinifera]|uniref:DNA mismatch repair protein MSH3 n=1 Tax=Exophiala spinifera TaxID=91928 RepID=A0A0D2BGE0_9EURO|nr:uncharacterized protein PV08_04905 [Exophiala spinifera]KIW17710.1 hypothetical protein PV08_04905 [Exophiala spinifera]
MASRTMSMTPHPTRRMQGGSARGSNARSRSRRASTSVGYANSEIVCAVTESRGLSPVVGLAFVDISTCEAVLCQFSDTQTYARTCHKISVYGPSEILYTPNAADSKLVSIIHENLDIDQNDISLHDVDRKHWSESAGHDYLEFLAFPDDLDALKIALTGNHCATYCFSAAMRYTELALHKIFAPKTLRIRFEAAEGSVMMDLSTIKSLELVQNVHNAKSRDCLYGLLNNTLTPMGARFLRVNILQPSTDVGKINKRQDAIEELSNEEHRVFALRAALKSFVDSDRILAALVVMSTKPDLTHMEQCVNHVLMLKTFVDSIAPIWQALGGSKCEELSNIYQLCNPENYAGVQRFISESINEDVRYSTKPTDLRNQRVYAIRAGINAMLDVARQTYKEIDEDVFQMVEALKDEHGLQCAELKFDTARYYFLRIKYKDSLRQALPEIFINIFNGPKVLECQTLELVKMNQKLRNAHADIIHVGDGAIRELIETVRSEFHPLFKISESIALLDMLSSLTQVSVSNNYIRPEITDTLALKACRHPLREKIQAERFVPNDVYATRQNRFQIVTGCNMSGKSTYIRSIALVSIMTQLGCFVPAIYASLPIIRNLFARASTDDSVEADISSFSGEMREMAFILRTISEQSLVIIDELCRGTSTTDGLAIAIAIAEALVESKALVWFVTHFRDLPRILAERAGVVNQHLEVEISADMSKMKMQYKVSDGYEDEKFYGLALAKVVGLPGPVIDVAEKVSRLLNERNEAQKRNPEATAEARRRKLILNLRERLVQARDSFTAGQATASNLQAWLKRLQSEFALRMRAIDIEIGESMSREDTADTTMSDTYTDTTTATSADNTTTDIDTNINANIQGHGQHEDHRLRPGSSMIEGGGQGSDDGVMQCSDHNGQHAEESVSATGSSVVDVDAYNESIERDEDEVEVEVEEHREDEHDSDTTVHVDPHDDDYVDDNNYDGHDHDDEDMMLDFDAYIEYDDDDDTL